MCGVSALPVIFRSSSSVVVSAASARAAHYLLSEPMGPMIILNSPRHSRAPERMARRHLEHSVRDPEMRRKLTPHFQFGCKRMLVSDDYLSTFGRDNVKLVTEGIAQIRERGV